MMIMIIMIIMRIQIMLMRITMMIIINVLLFSMYEEYQQSSISDQYDMRHHEVNLGTNKGVFNIAIKEHYALIIIEQYLLFLFQCRPQGIIL